MLLAGAVLFIAFVTLLSIKIGVRKTFGWLTIGLWPQRRHRGEEDPGPGSDLGEEARISAASVAQEWRVTIALHGAPGADRDRRRRRDVAREMRDRLGGAVAEDGGSSVLVYVDSRETAEAAAQVAGK